MDLVVAVVVVAVAAVVDKRTLDFDMKTAAEFGEGLADAHYDLDHDL